MTEAAHNLSQLRVAPFQPEFHKLTFANWAREWKLSEDEVAELPKIGFVAEFDGKPMAMGFIRLLENSKRGIVESLIANPSSSGKARHMALMMVSSMLVTCAKECGLKSLIAFTEHSAVFKRSLKFGFKAIPEQMIALSLKEK